MCRAGVVHRGLTAVSVLVLSACATISAEKRKDPQYLYQQACRPGQVSPGIKEAKGSVWLKAKSKEASGQFPASILVKSSDYLHLEVTNLLGGVEAVIEVQKNQYTITGKGSDAKVEKGAENWGGIPLNWSTDLFLGHIPCPVQVTKKTRLSFSVPSADSLEIAVRAPNDSTSITEKYVYHFRQVGAFLWPEHLQWEKFSPPVAKVEFQFDLPEDNTLSPLKWEAKSSHGEVKVKWRERELVRQ